MNTVDYKALLPKVASWIGLASFPTDWLGVDIVLPLLERMRQEGAVVVFKLDGERTGHSYTAVVSGSIMQGDFFRTDASSLEKALAYIIVHYAHLRWAFPIEQYQQ
jgi:hypothetical protein